MREAFSTEAVLIERVRPAKLLGPVGRYEDGDTAKSFGESLERTFNYLSKPSSSLKAMCGNSEAPFNG